jgi:uncharacterized protein (TIGR02996 family)
VEDEPAPAAGPLHDEPDFLRAIRAAPEDDGPRLAYADWLEGHGDPARAELIRLQCELAGAGPTPRRRKELAAREKALLEAHAGRWLGPLGEAASSWAFRRGMPRVGLSVSQFVSKKFAGLAGEWLREGRAQEVVLIGTTKHWEVLAACPLLAGLSALELAGNGMRPDGLQALLASPHLGRLHTLAVRGNQLYDAGVTALAGARWPRLRVLDLSNNHLGQRGAQVLADSPVLAGLAALDVGQNWLRAPGVQVLVSSPHLGRLRTLRLARIHFGDRGAAALAASPHLAGLTALDLAYNSLTDAAAQALAASPHLGRLAELNLSQNGGVGAAGVLALLA